MASQSWEKASLVPQTPLQKFGAHYVVLISNAAIWLVAPHSWIWTTRCTRCYQTPFLSEFLKWGLGHETRKRLGPQVHWILKGKDPFPITFRHQWPVHMFITIWRKVIGKGSLAFNIQWTCWPTYRLYSLFPCRQVYSQIPNEVDGCNDTIGGLDYWTHVQVCLENWRNHFVNFL